MEPFFLEIIFIIMSLLLRLEVYLPFGIYLSPFYSRSFLSTLRALLVHVSLVPGCSRSSVLFSAARFESPRHTKRYQRPEDQSTRWYSAYYHVLQYYYKRSSVTKLPSTYASQSRNIVSNEQQLTQESKLCRYDDVLTCAGMVLIV